VSGLARVLLKLYSIYILRVGVCDCVYVFVCVYVGVFNGSGLTLFQLVT